MCPFYRCVYTFGICLWDVFAICWHGCVCIVGNYRVKSKVPSPVNQLDKKQCVEILNVGCGREHLTVLVCSQSHGLTLRSLLGGVPGWQSLKMASTMWEEGMKGMRAWIPLCHMGWKGLDHILFLIHYIFEGYFLFINSLVFLNVLALSWLYCGSKNGEPKTPLRWWYDWKEGYWLVLVRVSRAGSPSPEVWVVMMMKDAEVRWFSGTAWGPFSQEAPSANLGSKRLY